MSQISAKASGTFLLGGDLEINRLGFGAMRITGPGTWGEPEDRDEALRVLRRLPELGVNFIDTADSYGPDVSENLIREALHPYEGLVIATKAGQLRNGPGKWVPHGHPAYLRQEVLMSLRKLNVERIDLWQLHRVDSKIPAEEQFAEIAAMQKEGLIRHVGLSEVSVEQIKLARQFFPVASVQNLYNLVARQSEEVLNYCEQEGIAFIPWFPLGAGSLAREGSVLDEIAKKLGAKPAQVALAWVLKRSPVMLPIPGTSKVAHLEENVAAASLTLSDEDFAALDKAGYAAWKNKA
jgi:Predicted oxidoreductases (related to aryl-alcohol dehydrogenases)